MFKIPNYQIIELLHESSKTLVYRGYKCSDQTPVILKTLRSDYPSIVEIAELKHEYELTKNLDIEGIVKHYDLEEYQNKPLLILEDFGGKDLGKLISANILTLEQCLSVAIRLVVTLGQLHQKQIIHKDIKPQNIIVNLDKNQVKLSDFSISSQLSKENPTISNLNLLEGTLAYISPEQTGRMNRAIDYRTDFYSLGVTLYEMLTGQLLFQAKDSLELVHCHIAKQPTPPHELKPEITEYVSAVVMKLLAKTSEERYQSTHGIKVDLETCLNQLVNTGKIEQFTIGQQDLSGKFEIPQKLYGREAEVADLMAAFDRVSQGSTEMMLVAGYSGIGKSALVNEVHKPIVRQRGYFITGKFDQYKRNIPYASLIQAFRGLIRQLLAEREDRIDNWKQKLLGALGNNGQVIIDVIPEVELIIGTQPSVAQLPPSEAQNRFNLVFKSFIHIFTQKEHPLVMFLDDLQWADFASLKLIELLTTDHNSNYLLMIGAYRDNEVSPTHPLIRTLEDIATKGAVLNKIILKNLDFAHINQLITDTVSCSLEKTQALARLIGQKTAGNPFFITQLLKHLYLDGFLKFNFSTISWEWKIAEIQAVGITDNVVELMISKIQKLSKATQNILKLAACVGNSFNLDVISVVNEKSPSATSTDLWEALQAGLIIPLSDTYKIPKLFKNFQKISIDYKFLHDRVQQAAYCLIPEDIKRQVHLNIGKLLRKNSNSEELEDNIFDIVNHLNIGKNLLEEQTEEYELANLNILAGRKAKAAAAYEAALKYLMVGLELLANNCWQSHYELALNLHVEAVEVQYLNINFEQAQKLSEIVLAQARDLLDKVRVYELKIQFYIAQNQMLEAIDTALPVVALLGYPLSQEPSNLKLVAQLPNLADLENFSEMRDPSQLAVLQILTIITGPAYQAKPDLLPFIVFKMVNLCLEFGHSSLAAYTYGMYGLMLCGPLGDIETGYHSGQLSLHILEQYPAQEIKCKIHMLFNSFVRHWKEHHRQTIPAFVETIEMGFESGDVVYVAYCCMWSCGYLLLTGDSLDDVEEKQRQYVDLLDNTKQEHGLYPAKTWRQLTLNLQGLTENLYQLEGESFNQTDMQHLETIQNPMLLFFAYFAKLILAYLFRDYETAVVNTKTAAQYQASATASMLSGGYVFYDSLARLALYSNLDSQQQKEFLEQIELNQTKLHSWAKHAPMNFQSKYELVEAEKARVLGQVVEAMEHYDRAIALAQEYGYIQEVAIASERAAEFYQFLGRERFAQIYLSDALYAYSRWGAKAKVKDLQQVYPQLASSMAVKIEPQITATLSTTMTSSYGGVLDLTTVMKATQAISGEIVLEKLLSQLMKLAIENAGAQQGLLILSQSDRLKIQASGAVDKDEVEVWQSLDVDNSNNLPVSLIRYVARTQENVVLSDATHEGVFTNDPYITTNQPKSILCTPIINQGKLISILYLENNLTIGAFTPDRLEVLRILSSQAAISIENARLYQNLEDSKRQLTQFLEAIPIGVSVHKPNGQIYYANQAAQELMYIKALPEAKTEQLSQVYQVYRAGTQKLYPTNQLPLVRALSGERVKADDLELHQADKIIPVEISTTPIINETGEIIYAIAAFTDITERKQAEKLLADYNCTLEAQVKERTAQLAQANQEITALNERLKAENMRMSAELEITKQLQQMVLPKQSELEAIEGLEIAGFMEPADEVGGDYYDVLHQNGRTKISIGDVTGHGLESGVLMLMTQTAVRTLQEVNETEPVKFLDVLNRTIYRNLERMNCEKNLTLAILDYHGGTLSLSGQHEEMIVVRADGQIEQIDTIDLGFPIGLDSEIAEFIATEQVQLNQGDVVVLYTDGITEAENINGEQYGLERLISVVSRNSSQPTELIRQIVIEDVRQHIGEQKIFDDITLVVLKQK